MSFEIKHKIIIYKKYLSGDQIHSILFNVWCLFLMLWVLGIQAIILMMSLQSLLYHIELTSWTFYKKLHTETNKVIS